MKTLQRIKLLLAYDGSEFKGWQKQKSHTPTIQASLEKALHFIFNEKTPIIGAGRTDAGVHALGQIAHFNVNVEKLTQIQDESLLRALNSLTPKSIVCLKVEKVLNTFHALLSPSRKTYKYLIYNSALPTAFGFRYTYWHSSFLNIDYLNELSKFLIGEKSFKSFQNHGTPTLSTKRLIYEAWWNRRSSKHWVEFTITGSGFLKQMIRNIVGTQLDMMRKKVPIQKFKEIIEARERSKAGPTAPPEGLYLVSVQYI